MNMTTEKKNYIVKVFLANNQVFVVRFAESWKAFDFAKSVMEGSLEKVSVMVEERGEENA